MQHPSNPDLVRVFTKGAPEIVIDLCDQYIDKDGNVAKLSKSKKEYILNEIVTKTFARKAYRTLLIAYTDMSMREYEALKSEHNDFAAEKDREVLEMSLTVVSILALQDPLRDEIVDSVIKCHKAGITIRMVTGDNLDTAKAIALEAGILKPEEADVEFACMEGK